MSQKKIYMKRICIRITPIFGPRKKKHSYKIFLTKQTNSFDNKFFINGKGKFINCCLGYFKKYIPKS